MGRKTRRQAGLQAALEAPAARPTDEGPAMSHDPERPALQPLPATPALDSPEWLRGPVTRREQAQPAPLTSGHLTGFDDEGRILFAPEDGGEPFAVAIA